MTIIFWLCTAAVCIAFLIAYDQRRIGKDDRPHQTQSAERMRP